MVEPIDEVENLFKTLDSELDYVALVVDSEFQKLQEAAGTKQLNQKRVPIVKPSEMLYRLSQIKIEFQHVVQEVETLRRAEKEAMEFFRDNLAAACENLEKLQKQAGLEVTSNKPADLQKLEALLHNESPDPDASEQLPGADGDNATSTPRKDYSNDYNYE